MRRFIPYIACGLLFISGWACTRTDDMDIPSANQDKIVIKTTLDPHVVTRATVADEEAERKITRIDVFVVDPATDNIAYRQTYTSTNGALNNSGAEDGNGTLTLGAERSSFTANKEYNVYLVANAPAAIVQKLDEKVEGSNTEYVLKTLGELKTLVHEAFTIVNNTNEVTQEVTTTKKTLLHLSGTTEPKADAPQTFMMDAVATTSGSTSKAVVLNDGVTTNNTSLVAEFKRAAAKIVVNIKQGASVQFERYLLNKDVSEGSAEYVFYNLPTETPVLADAEALLADNNTLIETDPIVLPQKEANVPQGVSYPTFTWKDNVGSVDANNGKGDVKIQIIGYAYAHNWENKPTLNFEPSLLLCLPMYWDANKDLNTPNGDGKETMRPGNWYKVPLSADKVFERNTCYVVNITINAVGAESKSEAIELNDIDYDTRPWDEVEIQVGDNTTQPKYLKLNTDLVTMYNTNVDSEQLIFSSSSPITSIVLADVYTQNADGEFVKVERDENGNFEVGADGYSAYYENKYSSKTKLSASEFSVSSLETVIKATAEAGKLSGNITITSPIGPDEASKNAALAKIESEKPEYPTVTLPTEVPDGFIDVAPEERTPESFLPQDNPQRTDVGVWKYTEPPTQASGNKYYLNYEREVTFIKYSYNSETGKFEYSEGKAKDTARSRNTYKQNDIPNNHNNVIKDTQSQADGDDVTVWTYIGECGDDVSFVKQYEDWKITYKEQLDAYNASVNNPEHQKYREQMQAYNDAMDEYNRLYAIYQQKVDDIEAAYTIPETHHNTVRYLEFLVTNEEGLQEVFRVEQYPTIFVQNVVGWFSYRDDFCADPANPNPTSFLQKGDSRYVGISYNKTSKTYTYYTTEGDGFWNSKVNDDVNDGNFSSNTSFDQRYYSWSENSTASQATIGGRATGGGSNSRMYHIQVTTSSSVYTIGRPLLIDPDTNLPTTDPERGVTEGSADNAKLVSPSFMTASQLGYFDTSLQSVADNTTERFAIARDHCKNYVEVAYDGTEYHNWRLPTAAEIQILINLQSKSDAIDKVLNATQYFSASGLETVSNGSSFVAVRCVRDAYDD
ncbi:MAG: DUF1566 domain-containing protein [Alistipes sp.]|nr:DUF1566 domain-containing protein [Alistipes sp.]